MYRKLQSSTSETQTLQSPPPYSVESSTSRRKYDVSVWQNQGFIDRGFLAQCFSYPYQYVCLFLWVCYDYKTLNQALPWSPVLVAAMLGGGRLQSSTSVGPLWMICDNIWSEFWCINGTHKNCWTMSIASKCIIQFRCVTNVMDQLYEYQFNLCLKIYICIFTANKQNDTPKCW